MGEDSGDGERVVDQSRRKFETVFEHANDAIFIVDVENDSITDCNPAAEELVEYSREELLSMPASDLHPHNLSKFMSFADRVLERGEGWTDDITCYCKSGDILPAEMSASVVELDGRPHLVNHVRGTTDRAERDWFEALIEHASDLITVVKPDGTVRYQSESVDYVLGYEPAELRDERFVEFVHPEDAAAVRAAIGTLSERSGSVVRRMEYRFRRADGSWAWLEGVLSHRPTSPITGTVVNARDVTPRTESNQQAAVLNRTLRHNLRNGLNVVIGHAEMLAETESGERSASAEAIVSTAWDLHDATAYAKDLADILESSQVAQQRHDLTELVERTADGLREEYPDADVTLDVPEDQYARATEKLDVALEHVARNAVEHNDRETPRVDVSVTGPAWEDDYVTVVVADDGPGIPDQERDVLLRGEETQLEHGSGLGLWVVNWIITRSGGYVAFEENEPRGSRVVVAVPPAR